MKQRTRSLDIVVVVAVEVEIRMMDSNIAGQEIENTYTIITT
jgi:hypothetical protein